MKPTYEVKAWQEGGWWLARVVAAGDGADPAPLDALTQARTLAKIGPMARDLIATILDADEDAFDVELTYALPDDVGDLLRETRGAREWLDAAQEWWQERSAAAARALTGRGYSLRETARLLGLSHQRIDQLLDGDVGAERRGTAAVRPGRHPKSGSYSCWTATEPLSGADVTVVVRHPTDRHGRRAPRAEEMHDIHDQIKGFLVDCMARAAWSADTAEKPEQPNRGIPV